MYASNLSVAVGREGSTHAASVPRILVVADGPDIAGMPTCDLGGLGEVQRTGDSARALSLVRSARWEALVLDPRLPGAIQLCRQLRQAGPALPILMLCTHSAEDDRVLGLEAGADDYLTQPFGTREVWARLRALWRRARGPGLAAVAAPAQPRSCELRLGALLLDRSQRRTWWGDRSFALAPREFGLLWYFASRPGRVFSREQLLAEVWGDRHEGFDHTVDSHISRLRRKLQGTGLRITTVWGVGYRLELPG